MQNITDVQNGLYNFLISIPGIPTAVQVENKRFIPSIRDPWIRTLLVPNSTQMQSLGVNGYNRLSGLYLIDLFYPAGRTPINDINEVADTIINSYINDPYITENSTNVLVMSAWRNTSIQEGDWYQLPITVRWENQATRNA